MIKILHLADLHLDSPFKNLTYTESVQRRKEQRMTFLSALEYAKTSSCKAVLLCGDLFDSEFYTRDTVSFLTTAFESYPEIAFVIAPGNHDPYKYGSPYLTCEFPRNVFIFKNEQISAFVFKNISLSVYGYAFTTTAFTKHPLSDFRAESGTQFSIMCAHGDTDTADSVYAPITEDQISACGLDYLALGHIHKRSEPKKLGKTTVAYSGALVGRDFSECGEKGGYLVTLDGSGASKSVICEKVTFCPWVYDTLSLDLDDCTDISDAISKTSQKLTSLNENDLKYHIRLTVSGEIGFDLDTEYLLQKLKPYGVTSIENKTFSTFERLSLDSDYSIRGEFYRKLKPFLLSEDEYQRQSAAYALKLGLKALNGESIAEYIINDQDKSTQTEL